MTSVSEWTERRLDGGFQDQSIWSRCDTSFARWRAAYETNLPTFNSLIIADAQLERIATGFKWTEGPVYFGDWDALVFSDVPGNAMWCWRAGAVTPFRSPSNFANGNTRDSAGRLVTCEHGTRSVTRTDYAGRRTVIAQSVNGMRLNSPNDVVVSRSGTIWFSDPTYGILNDYEGYVAESEYGSQGLLRCSASGTTSIALSDFQQPNGLAFSPDETILYVADSGATHAPGTARHIRSIRLGVNEQPVDSRILCEIDCGVPDGFRVDSFGNIWTSAGDGVHVFNSEGELLGKIFVPEIVSNLCFGGPGGNVLYITATTSVYRVPVAFATHS